VNQAEAIRTYQRALIIALIAPVFEYVRFILFGKCIPYGGVIIGTALLFAAFIPVLWFLGFQVIMSVSAGFHFVFGGSTTRAEWQQATWAGLWPWPYACALGVVIWIVYSLGRFGGPADLIFGMLGNLVGAWMYLSIFRRWYILRRSSPPHHPLPP
jgi:hypothetical protein